MEKEKASTKDVVVAGAKIMTAVTSVAVKETVKQLVPKKETPSEEIGKIMDSANKNGYDDIDIEKKKKRKRTLSYDMNNGTINFTSEKEETTRFRGHKEDKA